MKENRDPRTGRDDTDSPTSTSKKLVTTFILTWLTQFLVYSLRKPIGVLKIYIGNAMNLTNSQMGVFDIRYYKITSILDFVILKKIATLVILYQRSIFFSLLLPYSLIQIFGASYFDTVFSSPQVLISLCLTVASTSMWLSGFMYSSETYCMCLAISGLAQGPIWPACAKIMSNNCPINKRSSVIGKQNQIPRHFYFLITALI